MKSDEFHPFFVSLHTNIGFIMRRVLFFFCLFISMSSFSSSNNDARHLVSLLRDFQLREDVSPDSFFTDVKLLQEAITQQADSCSRAIYRATLAHLLAMNAGRSQVFRRDTESHSDSIQEWTSEEYRMHAAQLYAQSLQDMELLRTAPTSQWVPLVNRGNHEKVFGSDMLYVVWQAYINDIHRDLRKKMQTPMYADLISIYRKAGLREATLRLTLDSLLQEGSYNISKEDLQKLKQEYADVNACALVYMRMADFATKSEEQKEILEEALRLYPACEQKAEIQNRILELQSPILSWHFGEMCYPDQQIHMPLEVRNMQSMTMTLYQLPLDFQSEGEDMYVQVKRVGQRIRTVIHEFASHPDIKLWTDTLVWQSPDCGVYAMVVEGRTEAKLAKKVLPQVSLFRTSRLDFFKMNLPDDRIRVVVVDSQTGQPQQGVRVDFYNREDDRDSLVRTLLTDERGIVEVNRKIDARSHYVKISREGDEAQTLSPLSYFGYQRASSEKRGNNMRIFTDRAIYRPGQTVYVGAVAYSHQGWEADVLPDKEYTLKFMDANHQEILSHTLRTDEFGTLRDSLSLPEKGLPGTYQILIGNQTCLIRVEEYRRPTFQVEMDPVENIDLSGDSIMVTGRALTYSGVPVSQARVSGTYQWTSSWWYRRNDFSAPQQTDTVWTDASGKFQMRIPMDIDKEALWQGRRIVVHLDVLNNQGETQQGSLNIPVCTRPLRLWGQMEYQQDRDRLSPLTLTLYSPTDRSLEGSVVCRVMQKKKLVCEFTVPSGKPTVPEQLRGLPSGLYSLEAEGIVGQDSATWETEFVLMSMQDTRLAVEKSIWLYTPCDTFSVNRPAQVQFGTSFQDAWIYCTLTSAAGLTEDKLMHMSDSLVLWSIPYRKEYEQGVSVSISLYKEQKLYTQTLQLHLEQPDTRLRVHWDTFRDHLRPGQAEEWKLSLRQPDGMPAQANVMLSLYDASLDALAPHSMNFSFYRGYNIPSLYVTSSRNFSFIRFWNLFMQMWMHKTREFTFSEFNPDYFGSLPMIQTRNVRTLRQVNSITSAVEEKSMSTSVRMAKATAHEYAGAVQKFSMDDVEGLAFESADQALQGQIAGLNMESVEESEDGASLLSLGEEINVEMRNNLSELAFFMPQLRTDSLGQVAIAFTLPESLTRWHLLGLAHTKNLLTAQLDEMVVAQKELMAELYLPRFLRAGDQGLLTASIRNISETQQKGSASWVIRDAETNKVLKRQNVRFDLTSQSDTVFTLPFTASQDHPMLVVQWMAQGSDCSDGEQRYMPVLSDMETITETKAFSIRGAQRWSMDLSKLFSFDNPAAVNRSLTVEYTQNPKWLALQCLPSMVAPVCQDVLSLSAAYYAGSLAYHIAHTYPGIQRAVEEWQAEGHDTDSPLEKNQELTNLLLQETPWVLEAQREKTRRQRLGILFQEIEYQDTRMALLRDLQNLQRSNGSFSWFPGMMGSPYLTCEVAYMLTRLKLMTGTTLQNERSILNSCIQFMLHDISKAVPEIKKMDNPIPSLMTLRSLYVIYRSDYSLNNDRQARKDVEYLLDLLKDKADLLDREERALAAIVLQSAGEQKKAHALMPRLHTLLQHKDGQYLAYPSGSFTSIDRKLQTHVQLMEAIQMVEPTDTATLMDMQEWLIQQKRTQEWERPAQTADAIYALMQSGGKDKGKVEELRLQDGSQTYVITSPETSLGYVRERVENAKRPKSLSVDKKSTGTSFGAVYAQYQMPASQVQAQQEGLNIRRDIDKLEQVRKGDRIHVRYTITADRDYEYVRLAAPRPAAAEPVQQISGYSYQGGLGYYRAIHDASTEYFVDHMPRGTYVIEEDWLISHSGSYVVGPAILQCLYAPEYQAHTEGRTIRVENDSRK